ncbi:hypothetical protein LCGC14_0842990 [marine sediment metagenome]|uniref:Uncharacterized protein n=1 Tax=marine sediment metagenome TaxID=412755 RepID=A0A0F9RX64_9ZZZZ
MPTFDVKLIKASNTSVKHTLLLARGDEDEPRVRLGSREKEAAKAGQRGTIVIQSLHHGSGQHVSRDPMMYEFADGMFADEPGILQNCGEVREHATVGTALAFAHYRRGGILGTKLLESPDEAMVVVPTAIHDIHSNGVATQRVATISGAVFTGSHARLGLNVFFGAVTTSSETARPAARYATVANTITNDAGFNASCLVSAGDKMWRADGGLNLDLAMSWTDDADNATPVFSAPFEIKTGRLMARDIAVLGPHAVVAVTDQARASGMLVAVDTSGLFTQIMDELPMLGQFIPYLGGRLLIPQGGKRAYWLLDVASHRVVNMGGLPRVRAEAAFIGGESQGQGPAVGFYGAAMGEEIFFPMYGNFTKRDGTTVRGSAVVKGVMSEGGISFHSVLTPESLSFLTNAHVMAMRLAPYPKLGTFTVAPPAQLQMLIAQENASNASQSDVKVYTMEIDRGGLPDTYDTGTKFLRTSRYSTPSRTTGQMEVLRGYVTKLPASNSVVVRVYLDGSGTETYNFSLNSAGPFSQALPTNVIGRDIAIDFETNANGSVIIEFPWSIDYFAVPDQKDIVRLPILAGRDQLTRAGSLQKRTRADILDTLADICASPELWTLSWWDATPDWDVIPIDYQAADTEPDFVPGAGAAVAWLTLQRL